MHYDFCVVGCGLSGATFARLAADDGYKVLIIDKRNHIGGNVYDEVNKDTGIRVCLYGTHLFHTNDEEVWNFVQRFGEWIRWEHTVLALINNMYVSVPVNITTINKLFNLSLTNEQECNEWLTSKCIPTSNPKNSEEVAISRVGKELYELLFKNYTFKQWNLYPEQLDPLVLERIPVRKSFDTRYFHDKYQALPKNGYTEIVKEMIKHPNIVVQLNTEWDLFKLNANATWEHLIFTGPIDQYFHNHGLHKLQYRSIQFEWEILKTPGFYQPGSQVNYPTLDTPYTRCIEYKHLLNQKSDYTIICKEITTDTGEPYYPIPTQENKDLYDKYKQLATEEKGVHFIGRLANYKYFNMDQAIRNSIDYYMNIKKGLKEKI